MRNKRVMSLIAVVLATLSLGWANTTDTDPRTGIPIVTNVETGMFPDSWMNGEIKAEAEALDHGEADRSFLLVKKAMSIYPKSVLTENLKKVYVCKMIKFYGLEYGGTNSLDTVYLANKGARLGYSDSYLFGSFNHEFSSILLRNYPQFWDSNAWAACNPELFKYGHGGTDALRTGHSSTAYDKELAKQGFVAEYGEASEEEDFNLVVEGMFSGRKDYWELVDGAPQLAKKVKLAAAFYAKINVNFSEAFFRGLDEKTLLSH
ncbi:MAG: hypothetical protein JSS66_13270 [Armatimonadetes bacterium]|nr:hypothetical protein [Armatimonadota bacterium]